MLKKTEEINQLRHSLISLQNTLSSEQIKNWKVADEIKDMHVKNIRVEELTKEIAKKEEE